MRKNADERGRGRKEKERWWVEKGRRMDEKE